VFPRCDAAASAPRPTTTTTTKTNTKINIKTKTATTTWAVTKTATKTDGCTDIPLRAPAHDNVVVANAHKYGCKPGMSGIFQVLHNGIGDFEACAWGGAEGEN
jgi:hypothetical protein